MKVELVPVIELGYCNQGVDAPSQFPCWQYPSEWDAYHAENYRRAGFPGPLSPYCPGIPHYRLSELHPSNLAKVVVDHLKEFVEGKWERNDLSPLFGGYVLRINDVDELFPQCCGDLSDIRSWERLSLADTSCFWVGHPCPVLTCDESTATLRCVDEHETFLADPAKEIRVDLRSLAAAVRNARVELDAAAVHIDKAGRELGITDIVDLLIYGTGSDWSVRLAQ